MRRPINIIDCSPLSFFKMLRTSSANVRLMFVLLLGGVFGLTRMKQEVFPDFQLEVVQVTVVYPGASPAEVEQSMILAIEEAVGFAVGEALAHLRRLERQGRVTAEPRADGVTLFRAA